MPIKECVENKKPGWKYGDAGKCYIFDEDDKDASMRAKKKAIKQAIAIHGSEAHFNESGVAKKLYAFYQKI